TGAASDSPSTISSSPAAATAWSGTSPTAGTVRKRTSPPTTTSDCARRAGASSPRAASPPDSAPADPLDVASGRAFDDPLRPLQDVVARPPSVQTLEAQGPKPVLDPPDRVRGERDEVRIGPHERDPPRVGHDAHRVARQDRSAALRGAGPVQHRAPLEVSTRLHQGHAGDDLQVPGPA